MEVNTHLPEDVNQDNLVTPLDALLIINYLNKIHREPPPPYEQRLDVSRNGFISPLDVLIVINHLNRRSTGGEGEALLEVCLDLEFEEQALRHDLVFDNFESDLFNDLRPLMRKSVESSLRFRTTKALQIATSYS